MSVSIKIFREQDSDGKEYGEPAFRQSGLVSELNSAIGYVVAAVIKHNDGAISLERDIAVNADSFDDNELAEATVKTIERKLNEAFPDPNQKVPESKLWIPE